MRFLIPHLLDNTSERLPANEAVRCNGQSLTYEELTDGSNRLAHALVKRGVAKNDRVGIYANKGLRSAIAMYGILKAGGAYVPLDPSAPPSRIAAIVRDCGIRHLVSQPQKRSSLEKIWTAGSEFDHVIGLDEPVAGAAVASWSEVDDEAADSMPAIQSTELDLAYIIYTSGTTGVPKGIMHTHRSGLSFIDWAVEAFELESTDRISNHAPLHFDLSTFDFFAGASAGATTVIIPEAVTKLPASVSGFIEDERITIWYSVPAALIQLVLRGVLEARDLSSLRWVIFGGEAFPAKHLRPLMDELRDVRFAQLYGVTETNVCTVYHLPGHSSNLPEPIPIGKLLPNMEALIVDDADQQVAPGAVGELLIRAPATMSGYWGRSDLNAEAFLNVNEHSGLEERFYRTGDLVRLEPDGNFYFLGRKDRQVKSRGYRVELAEIEAALLSMDEVQEATVYTVPDGEGSHRIEATVVLLGRATEKDLLRHVKRMLPPYAVPEQIVLADELPRTSTGKVDVKSLQSRRTE